MSYLAFNAAPIEDNKNNISGDKKRNSRNKTIKKNNSSGRVADIINQIHKSSLLNDDNDDNDNELGDFDLPFPESIGSNRKAETEVKSQNVAQYNIPKPQDNSQGKWQEANWHQNTNAYASYPQQPLTVKNNKEKKEDGDEPVNIDGFKNLESSNEISNSPFLQNIPYYNQMSLGGSVPNRDELLTKLNYMIHILEEQQDQKTGHVTEEVVLYSFLGIFIIFIIDSFARAGKYVR